jgi:hypothetical protein
MLSHEGEGISHAQIFEKCWVAARKAKVAQTQAENEAKPKGMKTKLKGDERVYGKNKKKPLKIVSEVEGGEAVVSESLTQVDEIDDDINLEDPRDYLVEPLRDEFCFEEPYQGAKYNLVVPVDFSDQKLVPSETEHPHKGFVGRMISPRSGWRKALLVWYCHTPQKDSYSKSCTMMTMTKRIWTFMS